MYGISHVEAIKTNNKERKLAKKRKVRLVKARPFHIEFFNQVRSGLCCCQAARQLSGDDLALLLKAKEKEKEDKEKEEQQEGTALEGAEAPAEAAASG